MSVNMLWDIVSTHRAIPLLHVGWSRLDMNPGLHISFDWPMYIKCGSPHHTPKLFK